MSPRRAWELVRALSARFADAGSETPELDARVLVSLAATGDPSAYVMISRDELDEAARGRLEALAARRASGEPVARILGRREFWSRDFAVSAETLVPRPDTETLVASVLEAFSRRGLRDAPLRLLDLGTGSGCILVALLCELPNAWGLGVDISLEALRTARENAAANGVGGRSAFVLSDWGAGISGSYDGIVTNPPYIESEDVEGLAPAVSRYDPRLALDGGADGLDAYRAILPLAARMMKPDGMLAAEIGHTQAAEVASLAQAHGLRTDRIEKDLAGRDRVVMITR